ETGTLVLSNTIPNAYLGNTDITAGTLEVDGDNSKCPTVHVQSGATLSGTGQVGAINSTGGTISPGNPSFVTGSMDSGTLIFDNATTYTVDLGPSKLNFDQIKVNGGVS